MKLLPVDFFQEVTVKGGKVLIEVIIIVRYNFLYVLIE
jgi:hypothetical protein